MSPELTTAAAFRATVTVGKKDFDEKKVFARTYQRRIFSN